LLSGDIKHVGRLDALSGERPIQGKRCLWENHVRNGLSDDFEFLWPRTCGWNAPTIELQHERCQGESVDSRRRIECKLVGKYWELSLSLWGKRFDENRSEFLSTARATEILIQSSRDVFLASRWHPAYACFCETEALCLTRNYWFTKKGTYENISDISDPALTFDLQAPYGLYWLLFAAGVIFTLSRVLWCVVHKFISVLQD
jgi:hypothetical protein